MRRAVVGIDIGGANLKAARWVDDQKACAVSTTFPMWTQHARLAEATGQLLEQLPLSSESPYDLAVTMTGELADCFQSRRDGVAQILTQLRRVLPAERIFVYGVDGRWLSPSQALSDPWNVAASNWHALGSWLGRWPPTSPFCQQALVIDIGSTTVDIIPLSEGQVATPAKTDRDRLQLGQLIYTGLRRTPVCAVAQQLTLAGQAIPVMAELFATVDDAWLVLGQVDEDALDMATADHRPRTKSCAAARLARMIGEDSERLSDEDLESLASQVIGLQVLQIKAALERQLISNFSKSEKVCLICSGHGLPLWRQLARNTSKSMLQYTLADYMDREVARCAPAAAVAWLLGQSQVHLPY